MTRLLKYDANFTPCSTESGDELFPNGIFEFNITKMLKYIRTNPVCVNLEVVAVGDFIGKFTTINESHVDSVDISQPVILAEISPGQYNLIDGHHRMEKARRLEMKSISAYRLKAEQHIGFLTSKKAYLAFIDYWNGKLKELDKYNG